MTFITNEKAVPPAHVAPRPYRSAPIFTPYVVICTMFGALSLGYMSVAFTAPDWLDDLTPVRTQTATDSRATVPNADAELTELRDAVALLQADMTRVKTDVEANSELHRNFGAQLAALEQRLVPAQASAQPPAPASPQSPKLINADGKAATALETGSVTTDAAPDPAPNAPLPQVAASDIKFGPAVVKPALKPLGIQISSGPTVDDLRVSWSLLSDNYGDDLKKLEPRYAANGDPANPNYDLVAGPLKSKAEAIKVCKALVAKSVPCKVTDFVGNAL